VGKAGGKRLLERFRRRRNNSVKTDLRERGKSVMHRIDLAQDRRTLQGSCEHGNKPSSSTKRRIFLSR
jgi:hypothetical protein